MAGGREGAGRKPTGGWLERTAEKVGAVKLIGGTLVAVLIAVATGTWVASNIYHDFEAVETKVEELAAEDAELAGEIDRLEARLEELADRVRTLDVLARQAVCESRGFLFDPAELECLPVGAPHPP